MTNNKTHDALIIPTGEPREGENRFPVTNEAVKAFNGGKYGCIYVTGGYGGFDTAERKAGISEGKETYDYILSRGVPSYKVYYDDQSLDSVGNFTFPIVKKLPNNPNFLYDFDSMEIFAKEGHMWRIKDYAIAVMQSKIWEGKIDFHSLPGEHNNGRMARMYHKGLMNALKGKYGPEEIHDFLIKDHPFYSKGWFDKAPLDRKIEMAAIGLSWFLR